MNTSFEKNSIRPGDPDYEYDKQVDFSGSAKVEAGWDSPEEDFWSWAAHWMVGLNEGKKFNLLHCLMNKCDETSWSLLEMYLPPPGIRLSKN